MTVNPLEDHSLDKYRLFSVELERLTRAALGNLGLDAKSVDRCKNFFALGMCYWLYNRSMESTLSLDRRQIQEQAAARRSEQARNEGGLFVLRSHRSVSDQLRNSAGETCAGHLPQYERQSGAGVGICHRVAKSRDSGCSRAAIRSLPRRTFFTNFRSTKISASSHSRPKTKSPRSLRRSALPTPAHSRITTTSGPGMALKTEAHRPRRRRWNAARDLRHSARRPFDRLADENRTGRFAASAFRTKFRSADSRDRSGDAERLFLGRRRSLPHRFEVHGAGHHSVGRLSRQRRGAVEDSRVDEIPDFPVEFAKETNSRTPICHTNAIQTRSRGHGRFPAHRDSSTASAASKSRTSQATSITSHSTTSTWSAFAPQKSQPSCKMFPTSFPPATITAIC